MLLNIAFIGFIFLAGACLGSFYSVLVYRLPRDQSIVFPGSRCPGCGIALKPWHNIPILSFILQHGQCAFCKRPVSLLYPGTEIGTAVLVTLLLTGTPGMLHGMPQATAVLTTLVLSLLVPLTAIDMRHGIVPHLITIPGVILSAVIAFLPGGAGPLKMLAGLAAGGGGLWLIAQGAKLLVPPARRVENATLGGGDIMVLMMYGALLGPGLILFGLAAGSVFATLYVFVFRFKRRSEPFPFVPFLSAGIMLAAIAGKEIIAWYLKMCHF